jgi:DNA helicase MCM9
MARFEQLIRDKGTGKSKFLRFASCLCLRSIIANGIGSTSAGLTMSCIRENGEYTFEAGALVLADMGVCCIDEFNLLHKNDIAAIHEAMEQQTISMSKAHLNMTAQTRTTVIAACNPVLEKQMYNPNFDISKNTGLELPILSRFDLVFVIANNSDPAEEEKICDFILNKVTAQFVFFQMIQSLADQVEEIKEENETYWSLDKLKVQI